jgi:hypothetical protein
LLCTACGSDDAGNVYGVTLNAGTLTAGNDSLDDGTDSNPGDGDGDGDPGDGDGDPGDGDGDPGPKLDVIGNDEGVPTADDGANGDGCQKVDFLFVIDNSGSMLEEQDNLAGSFPSFINSISTTLDAAQDYHIMVIDTDAWVYASCGFLCGFPLPGRCGRHLSKGRQREQHRLQLRQRQALHDRRRAQPARHLPVRRPGRDRLDRRSRAPDGGDGRRGLGRRRRWDLQLRLPAR